MARKKVEEEKVEEIEKEELDLTTVKEELTDYMKNKIDKEVSVAVEKATKKLVRHKNAIIIKRDILIIILLGICLILGYSLYKNSNINIDVTKDNNTTQEKVINEQENDSEEVPLENLTEKYGYLIDNIQLDEESNYIKTYYRGELSDEIKLYISLNNLDKDKIVSEDDSIYVEEKDLKEVYDSIFDGDFAAKSFRYGSLNFHYLLSKEMFIADGKYEKTKSNIVKEIIDIEDKDNEILITTVEGLLTGDRLYNILSGEQIKRYDSKDNLETYKKDLTNVIYNFNKVDDNYKLEKIEII